MRTLRRWTLGAASILGLAATGCGQDEAVTPPSELAPAEDNGLGFSGASASSSTSSGGGESTTSTSGASSSGGGSDEICGNGLDDDGNGKPDDGCPCEMGAEQACYLGAASQAGQGACVMGKQACAGADSNGEFSAGTWGACVGSGAPLTCDAMPGSCGKLDDGCGGTVDCGDCASCTPGSKTFEQAGEHSFTVPGYKSLTVKLWGAGGGGGAYGAKTAATDGGTSSFDGSVVAEGGKGGVGGGAEANGGAASGGTKNLKGGNGAGACDKGYPFLCGNAKGGSAPDGGSGGQGIHGVDGCAGGDGHDGKAPGGGGAGAWACLGPWLIGQGWGFGGGGAGAGGHASKTYAAGELSAGKAVKVVVGAGGLGTKGVVSDGAPGTGKNPGYYTGGDGAVGHVIVEWTCP
jgi:hypothetical protein